MSHSQQQPQRCHELFTGGDTDSRVYMELVLGHSAAKAARDQCCPSLSAEALARARRALHIARANNRPDLEEKAQLGKAEFLSMIGRRRESLEVEILVAARAERMEIERGTDGRVVSVEGVSMDEVVVRLGRDVCKRGSLKDEIVMAAEAEGLAIEEGEDGSVASVGGVPMEEVTRLLMEDEVDEELSSSFCLTSQQEAGDSVGIAHTRVPRSCARSHSSSDASWDRSVQGRRVSDSRIHLVTVMSAAPELRRKPSFLTL